MMAVGLLLLLAVASAPSQQTPQPAPEAAATATETPSGLKQREQPPEGSVIIPRGTRVPLVLINSVSTKHAAPGDRVYLESVYPVAIEGKILIPPGTYVSGSVTEVKRPGRVKGRGELYVRFEQMILPNGTIRDFTGRVGALDGRSPEGFDREEGKITSESNKGGDARSVGEATAIGTSVGTIAGAAGGRTGMGLGLGAAAGAAAGLAGVLFSRGPDAMLEKGTQLDMVLDRDLFFSELEMTFENSLQRPGISVDVGSGPNPNRNKNNQRGGGFPF
jgi:type IV secretion system protein VirB10